MYELAVLKAFLCMPPPPTHLGVPCAPPTLLRVTTRPLLAKKSSGTAHDIYPMKRRKRISSVSRVILHDALVWATPFASKRDAVFYGARTGSQRTFQRDT
ncbi:hypothetical protein GN244_ATG12859 [Phytophthora infestans]|uniref:Uncharacterized protein n=1 Tax=Phytophthora infestans TaxID=4787 RepID=A0A833VZ75_PHYIN|nr:hypothetical protein GN244_ATG12859 [Phytophthora infestans]KAF4134738.1 hypothetical protein GN958_ATG15994 [Phytophthora infestans]